MITSFIVVIANEQNGLRFAFTLLVHFQCHLAFIYGSSTRRKKIVDKCDFCYVFFPTALINSDLLSISCRPHVDFMSSVIPLLSEDDQSISDWKECAIPECHWVVLVIISIVRPTATMVRHCTQIQIVYCSHFEDRARGDPQCH